VTSQTDPLPRARAHLGDVLYAGKAQLPPPEAEWAAIVQRIGAGDEQALRALYQRTHRIVFTLAVRITNSRETAEELTVDVFHDVWRRAAAYDPADGTVIGWIMNQARSRAIDRLRFEQRKKRVNPYTEDPLADLAEPEPEAVAYAQEQARILRAALVVLTADERQAIEAAYFSGLTYAEVGERLSKPLGTVKTRIRSGMAKLREALGAEADNP
jgi:RNA polymerase sigma-70 factor, ECF subfamily